MRRILVVFVLVAFVSLVVAAAAGAGARICRRCRPRDRSVAIGDGLELNVRELGTGSPVVLVHGLPSNIGDWAGVPDALAALGHRVVVYDRVGYGWSSRPPVAGDAYTLGSNARELGCLARSARHPAGGAGRLVVRRRHRADLRAASIPSA